MKNYHKKSNIDTKIEKQYIVQDSIERMYVHLRNPFHKEL